MSNPYVGEIRLFAGNYAPLGWAFCDGSLLPIAENVALFELVGTTYGGDGQETFGLPDLRGRVPVHQGSGFAVGQAGGSETVSLTTTDMPAHGHPLLGTSANATAASPNGTVLATLAEVTTFAYGTDLPLSTLDPRSVGSTGLGQPHENVQPFLCLSYIVSISGIFPATN